MDWITVYRNVMSGQNKGCLLRLQIGYTAVHLVSIGGQWQGPRWGFFAPIKVNGHYRRLGFYGSLLPALGKPVPQWPAWYRAMWKITKFKIGGED